MIQLSPSHFPKFVSIESPSPLNSLSTQTIHTLSLSLTHTHNSALMALQVSRTPPSSIGLVPCASSSWSAKLSSMVCVAGGGSIREKRVTVMGMNMKKNKKVGCVKVWSSLDTAGPVVVGQVTEVCKDTFWPIVKAAGDKTVVLDMYTQ
ncbi:unnamed protein product [Ilex paraguariensis]|uniref:Uncharacterized protein n=1 Tax=Ilex paraguariensis TaxID=185542 RepID=A0ABC8R547_9AQUA